MCTVSLVSNSFAALRAQYKMLLGIAIMHSPAGDVQFKLVS